MKKSTLLFLMLLIILFSVSSSLFAQVKEWEEQLKKDPENKEVLLNLGKFYHNAGGNDMDEDAVKKAEDYLTKLVEIDPRNALGLVYLGSTFTLRARDASSQEDQLGFVSKGFARMDKAVYFEPDNIEVRMVRGVNSMYMPDMLGRLATAMEDFGHLEKLIPPNALNLEEQTLLLYYYYYGVALTKNNMKDKAKKMFAKTIEVDPDAQLAKSAAEELEKIKELNK